MNRPQNGTTDTDARREPCAPYTGIHLGVRRFVEPAQDLLILALAVILFALMARILVLLVGDVLEPEVAFRKVIAQVLFMLVMVEIIRLLIIYLRDHHVAVDVMVELSIVSVLREVVLLGIVELGPLQILAIAAFVLALGILLRFGTLRTPGRHFRDPLTPHCPGPARTQPRP